MSRERIFLPLREKSHLVFFGVRVTDAFEPFVNSDWYRYELSNVADDPGRTRGWGVLRRPVRWHRLRSFVTPTLTC